MRDERHDEAGSRPYLSVVATARNDNHGGDLLPRMQVFLNGLAHQADRFALPVELVLVDWNPPADRPRLVDALEWPASEYCTYRVVEVPPERHAELEHADRLPLFQMIAKNVAIRRARGEFVLATNVDILLPDELMGWIAGRDLREDRVYRVDRHDVDIAPDPSLPTRETLRLAEQNVVRICARMGSYDLVTGAFYRIYEDQRLPLWARRLAHIWWALRRRLLTVLQWLLVPVRWATLRLRRVLGAVVGSRRHPILHYRRFRARRRRSRLHRPPRRTPGRLLGALFGGRIGPGRTRRALLAHYRRTLQRLAERYGWHRSQIELPEARLTLNPFAWLAGIYKVVRDEWRLLQAVIASEAARIPLHTNASGDFTLLSREAWIASRAYPELELFSMHIDGLFLYLAHYAGFKEEFVPHPIFHIEHTHGFKPNPQEVRTLNTRLERAAIPQITNEQFLRWILEMYEAKAPIAFNDDAWGFPDEALPERTPAAVVQEAIV